jgi:hypothetical protein
VLVFAISVEHPLDVAVQCSHDANARHHGRAVEFDYQDQGFYRGRPLLELLFGLGQLLDIFRRVLQGDGLANRGAGEWVRRSGSTKALLLRPPAAASW